MSEIKKNKPLERKRNNGIRIKILNKVHLDHAGMLRVMIEILKFRSLKGS